MGKIILNNIEYGIGTSNGVNVDTTNLVKKDSIVTVIDENVTDEQIPSAKAVHTAIQNVSTGVPADVYSKTEVDDLLADKADSTDIIDSYTKEEVDNLLNDKVNTDDLVDAYSKTEVDGLLDGKADSSAIVDAYTKDEVNDLLADKADSSTIVDAYTKDEVDDLLADKADSIAIVDAYSKTEVDTLLTGKADSTDIIDAYSKTEVDNLLANKANSSAIEEAKTELENEIANIPKVTKTSELTNDSGYITASDIPVTLPASDVYDWAKEATKPTYTSAEVGALASNGTATNASKVANNLTLQIAGATKNTFNGSSAQTFNIPNASTSTAGVMTTAQVTKLNGIATGATKNTIDTAMSSTSTNAVQNKVIYAYIQEQIQNAVKNAVKSAGDYMGKTMISVNAHQVGNSNGYTYTNNKGGFADFMFQTQDDRNNEFELIVDGVTIITSGTPSQILKKNTDSTYELKIPFKSTFTVRYYISGVNAYLRGFIYVNE